MGNTNSIPEAQRTMQRQLQYCQERRTQLQRHISSLEALAWREKDEIERNMVSVCSPQVAPSLVSFSLSLSPVYKSFRLQDCPMSLMPQIQKVQPGPASILQKPLQE
ncbi:hypothetical protein BHM03_00000412 [Ensete ventricosum]|nr:hypothetical protein BHM03_00000412 [Ensete ventricosum]